MPALYLGRFVKLSVQLLAALSVTSLPLDSVTFKVTGTIMNGYTSPMVEDNRVPLRRFVFGENSFDEDGWTHIEVRDPHSQLSYGYNSGWRRVWEKDAAEGRSPSQVFYFWTIDTRSPQMGVEMLEKENYYDE